MKRETEDSREGAVCVCVCVWGVLIKASSRKRSSSEENYVYVSVVQSVKRFACTFFPPADVLSCMHVHTHTYITAVSRGTLAQGDKQQQLML